MYNRIIMPKIGLDKASKNQVLVERGKRSAQYKKMIHYPN